MRFNANRCQIFLYFSLWVLSKFPNIDLLIISVTQVLWCSRMFCYKDQNLNTPILPPKIIRTTHPNFISIVCNLLILKCCERYSASYIMWYIFLRWEGKPEIPKCFLPQFLIPFSTASFHFFIPTIEHMQEASYSKMANWSSDFWILHGFLAEHHNFKAILRF